MELRWCGRHLARPGVLEPGREHDFHGTSTFMELRRCVRYLGRSGLLEPDREHVDFHRTLPVCAALGTLGGALGCIDWGALLC